MSNLSLYINNSLIPPEDILKYPKEKEKLSDNNKILPSDIKLTLDNVDKTKYDDRYPGSFFYATDWYGDIVELYDNDLEEFIFKGTLTNLLANDGAGELDIEASNYLVNLKDKTCIYSNNSDKTPSAIIYELLTDSDNGNIDASNIVFSGFQNAINIQDANSVYYNVNFDAENNKNVMDVINELCRITQCHVYSKKNLIYLYQWTEYNGEIGTEIAGRHLVTKTFKQFYDDSNIYNSYNVAYDNSGTVNYSEDNDATSISTYGERVFKIPDDDVDSTSSSAFNILCRNQTGADYVGDLALNRLKNQKKLFTLTVVDSLNTLQLGDQIDLNFDNFVREPGEIIEREYNRDKREIKFKGEFSNLPVNYYSRDTEPPQSPELISAIPSGNGAVTLKWTKSTESDFLGYKVYLTATPGMWYQEECNLGKSPIDLKIDQLTEDGYIFNDFSQLNPGTQYYFKVTAYDTSFNESDDSNVKSATTWNTSDGYFNLYRCSGNIVSNVGLDEDNNEGGTVLSTWNLYNSTILYDGNSFYSPCSVFESGLNYNESGMTLISWKGTGDSNDIKFQYRSSDDKIAWSDWSNEVDAIGNKQVNFSNKYIHFRFIFESSLWTDLDNFYVKELY